MDGSSAFRPMGNTAAISAAGTAPTPIQIPGPVAGEVSYMVYNSGTVAAFLAYGSTQAAATANATAPVAGTPQPNVPIAPGAVRVFTLTGQSGGLWFTATASSASTVYVTPGFGI